MSNFSYQPKLTKECCEKMRYVTLPNGKKVKAVILSACTGSGKTEMAISMINPEKRTLILTNGLSDLRKQWYNRMPWSKNVFIIDSGRQSLDGPGVFITLPQTIYRKASIPEFDFLIIDEAHEYFLASMIQDHILPKIRNPEILLLTATPFNLRELKIPEVAFTIEDGMKKGITENVKVELLTSKYDWSLDSYNKFDSIKTKEIQEDGYVYESMNTFLDEIFTYLTSKLSMTNTLTNKKFSFINKHLEKTMIICNSIHHSNLVKSFLDQKRIDSVVSNSEVDPTGEKIDLYRDCNNTKILVVVDRGKLGFDMPSLVNVVDISGTLNVSVIFQALGRLTRKHNTKKTFYKIVPNSMIYLNWVTMNCVMSLISRNFFMSFDSNYKNLQFPVDKINEPRENHDKKQQASGLEKSTKKFSLDFYERIEIFNACNVKIGKELDRYGTVSINEARKRVSRYWKPYMASTEELIKHIKSTGATCTKELILIDPNCYAYLHNTKILKQTADMMGWNYRVIGPWVDKTGKKCVDFVIKEKYQTIKQWKMESPSSYEYAMVNNLLDYVIKSTGIVDDRKNNWKLKSEDEILELVKSINPKSFHDINKKNPGLYSYLKRSTDGKALMQKIRNIYGFKRKKYNINPEGRFEELLQIAKSGKPRPVLRKGYCKIASYLNRITRPDEKCYDEKKHCILLKLRPDWFNTKTKNKKISIRLINKKTQEIHTFRSITQASKFLGYSSNKISRLLAQNIDIIDEYTIQRLEEK